jgi:hypothetical protein
MFETRRNSQEIRKRAGRSQEPGKRGKLSTGLPQRDIRDKIGRQREASFDGWRNGRLFGTSLHAEGERR